MSEEINLENNLSISTTEDAFERFQAAALYEEDELITLSDIVSPPPVAPEIPSELGDIPFDNEIELTSTQNQLNEVNNQPSPGYNETNSTEIALETNSNNHHDEPQSVVDPTPELNIETRPKRARIQKHYYTSDGDQNQSLGTDNVPNQTSTRGRRGRKPKISPDMVYENSIDQLSHSLQTDESLEQPSPRKRGRKKPSVQNSNVDATSEQKTPAQKTPSRRGRGKKQSNNQSTDLLDMLTKTENASGELNPSLPAPVPKLRGRRSKKQKSMLENVITVHTVEENIENVLENVTTVNKEEDNIENALNEIFGVNDNISTDTADMTQTLSPSKTQETSVDNQCKTISNVTSKRKQKRGRRSKKAVENTIDTSDINGENKTISDDDDNICLSKLSQKSPIRTDSIVEELEKPEVLTSEIPNEEINEEQLQEPVDIETEDLGLGKIDMAVDSYDNDIVVDNDQIEQNLAESYEKPDMSISENKDIGKIESEVKENGNNEQANIGLDDVNNLLVENSSKRPVRRKANKNMHYEEDSDEDPFANVVLSDDEPSGRRKRYYSDDEYIPEIEEGKKKRGRKRQVDSDSDTDFDEMEDDDFELKQLQKRKRNSESKSPKKKPNFDSILTTIVPKVDTIKEDDDIEVCLQSSVIKAGEDSSEKLGWKSGENEFESFIANKIQGTNLQIKKVSSSETSHNTPLEIPVLDPEAKKSVEMGTQTNTIRTKNMDMQTDTPYEVPMKTNVILTPEQSEKACEFLQSIVKTTSELGQLMTQKSEDFITKKINTNHVTDTFKMDYCVQKSFLLLKLAKSNLYQMEEDLAKQYEEFLKINNLSSCREEVKKMTPSEKAMDNDSDCEIVEEVAPKKGNLAKQKPKFNPKTVFLNKELSIKIAKKPATPAAKLAKQCKDKLNLPGKLKGKHEVWISDSVMVKKVKPTQSFLAQDSRNKKPPDSYVTEKMVSNFFENYNRQQVLKTCAPFVSAEWLQKDEQYICAYFVVSKSEQFDNGTPSNFELEDAVNFDIGECSDSAQVVANNLNKITAQKQDSSPQSLMVMCTEALQKYLNVTTSVGAKKIVKTNFNPEKLVALCIKAMQKNLTEWSDINTKHSQKDDIYKTQEIETSSPESLFRLCIKCLSQPCHQFSTGSTIISDKLQNGKSMSSPEYHYSEDQWATDMKSPESLSQLCLEIDSIVNNVDNMLSPAMHFDSHEKHKSIDEISPESLLQLSLRVIRNMTDQQFTSSNENSYEPWVPKVLHEEELSFSGSYDSETETIAIKQLSEYISHEGLSHDPKTLRRLCIDKIVYLFALTTKHTTTNKWDCNTAKIHQKAPINKNSVDRRNGITSLSSLCLEILKAYSFSSNNGNIIDTPIMICEKPEIFPKPLKTIAIQFIKNFWLDRKELSHDTTYEPHAIIKHDVRRLADICLEVLSSLMNLHPNEDVDDGKTTGLTINSVNTLSEEAFLNINDSYNQADEGNYDNDDDTNFYQEDEYDAAFDEEFDESQSQEANNDSGWAAQVKMQELTSFHLPTNENNQKQTQENDSRIIEEQPMISHVKLEPVESPEEECESQIDSIIVKREPMPDEMIVIPENVVAKQEFQEDHSERDALHTQSSSFDVDSFERFASSNKLLHPLDEDEDIFSQSGLRVRRQHDPDYINDYDTGLTTLLEPLNIETAKDRLMESSSEEEGSTNKSTGKKKQEKRGRPRKKIEKQTKKDTTTTSKEKSTMPVNEVAILTRRMRERIRQEEKKIASSDSETEDVPINAKKIKDKKGNEVADTTKTADQIQCNEVDSTEQVDHSAKDETDSLKSFTGFSAVDQNEVTSYQKYMKFVYDKIMPKEIETEEASTSREKDNENQPETPLINYDDPVEMLECEPTMPIFDDTEPIKPKRKPAPKSKSKPLEQGQAARPEANTSAKQINESKSSDKIASEVSSEDNEEYIDRNGWKCYPISTKDTKLYQSPLLILEKLPESFVETYNQYQSITTIHREDQEVDRLINLNSLARSTNLKEGKGKPKGKIKPIGDFGKVTAESGVMSPTFSDNDGNEFSPSEDEEANVNDEVPPPVKPHGEAVENNLAKNSLMDDSDSDSPLSKVKSEQIDEDEPIKKKKSKTKLTPEKKLDENLTLTADKMMKKELNLLHAPVNLVGEVPSTSKEYTQPKSKKKSGSRHSSRHHTRGEDDSSSDEEKQWVTTKEKLLKRLERRQDTTMLDDAKRTKLVNEFIVRREEGKGKRKSGGRVRGRISKRRLEREKQLRVLSNELYGEAPHKKGTSHGLFHGRRNIRKVIDKKSLARSTVIANMEEFERKRRLVQKQAKLRELLGYEESVNVLVINDEVCLEYDLAAREPVVTVHSFFTKVMKAHQYEGVKFMWDACFESLAAVASGSPGGGCILAHCMGLGKTLQVLALLHTVLTHPSVGMQRVLVCCPLSTVLNWVDEIHKWITPVTDEIKVFELSKLKKTYERAFQLEDWYTRGGIFIIGYELFRSLTTLDPELDDIRPTIVNKIRTALLDPGPDIIVCDEGHLLKNDCSVLAVAMSRVATKRRIVLTGTPMQNNLREYYCMVNFIKPNLLGTYPEYSNRFENPIMNGQHRDSSEEDIKLMKERTHILHKVLEGCLQRQEASVLYPYLPKKHEYTLFISLTSVQWDLYKCYIQNFANQNKHSVLKDFHVLQKIWSHPQVLHNFQIRARDQLAKLAKMKPEKLEDDLAQADLAATEDLKPEDVKSGDSTWWLQYLDGGNMLETLESSNKFVIVFRILDECISLGDKVLIFSTSLFTMDALEYFLKKINKWSLGQEYYRLDGSVPAEVRQKWCREFNAENNVKTKLFLISTRAGSLGLNMVAANRVIILDTSWNPAHDIQSIFRVYRFGQKKDCYIYRLVAMGTMEQKIYERSVTKQAVACRVVDEQQIERHYNMAELTELYRYDESGCNVAPGVAVGVRDVALLRVARLAALHAVQEHDSLLRGSAEPSLPEHERAAAWMQFQEEHANKQRQNQLEQYQYQQRMATMAWQADPRFQTPDLPPVPSTSHLLQYPQLSHLSGVKTEPCKVYSDSKTKGKKVRIPLPTEPTPNPAKSIQDGMVKKITDILIKHNHQHIGPHEMNTLVHNVRKMVALGHIARGGPNDEMTETIANVLLGKEPPQPIVEPTKEDNSMPKRGRPRKRTKETPTESQSILPEPTVDIKPNIEDNTVDVDGRIRRRAAIAAKKQLESSSDDIVDLGCDEDWVDQSDDNVEQIVEGEKPRPKSKKTESQKDLSPQATASAQKELNTEINSILLSDDDEPVKKSTKNSKKTDEDGPVPLHPSLLSNKNFIKIIAHTYLEGNPMLDEDAATLAAQYSALKAQKEMESTGKPIQSGPIYDIAVKVLGRDILQKLHKSNAKKTSKPPAPAASTIKTEPTEVPKVKLKAKGIAELTGKPERPPTPKKSATQPPKPQPITLSRPIKMTGLTSAAAGASETTASPTVVPIGMFSRARGTMPATAQMATPKEESILPDDDDVIISDSSPAPTLAPSPAPSKPTPQLPNRITMNDIIQQANMRIPKLKISGGKIVLNHQESPTTENQTIVPINSNETICLDSDEEAIMPTEKPKAKRPVAVKSTAKRQKPVPVQLTAVNNKNPVPVQLTATTPQGPVPVQLTAANQPVPVQLTAANPLNPGQPQIIASQPATMQQPFYTLRTQNYTVVPNQGNKLSNLTQGVIPPNARNIRFIVNPQQQTITSLPQNMNQQNVNLITQIPQNQVPQNSTPYILNQSSSQNQYFLAQNQNTTLPPGVSLLNGMPMTVTSGPSIKTPLMNINIENIPNSESILTTYQPPNPTQTNSSESVVSNAKKPGPASAKAGNKTVCKPGDILRITKTGQVEILNRDGQATTKNKDNTDTSTTVDLSDDEEPIRPTKTYKAKATPTKPSRSRSSSSSSSSSDSRPNSPTNDDPLSILKDVVHIQAPDVPVKPKPSAKDTRTIGSTSITKSNSNSNTPNKLPAHKTTTNKIIKATVAATSKKDKIIEQINKTNTVLKKLNDVLGPANQRKTASKYTIGVDSVDLTESAKPVNKSNMGVKIMNSASKSTPTKLVGTSKDIILTTKGGKAALATNSQAKKINVTSVEKVAPAWSDPKKRPATAAASALKKKKTTQAINDLRYFNCDSDNDEPNIPMDLDIIELE